MLRKIFIKELIDCFRDRRTLLLTVLLPIVMMTGLTLFYENLISDGEGDTFTLAVNQDFTTDEKSIISVFENISLLPVLDPEEAVKEGDAQAALIFQSDFNTKVQNGEQSSVTIIGDSNSQNSSNLMHMVTTALSSFEKTIITNRLVQEDIDTHIIQPFTIEKKEVSEESPALSLIAMMIPLFLAMAIGIGAGPAASDLFAGEKEKKTMEALLMTPVNRATLLFSKWLTITTIGALTGIITLVVVVLEITFLTENLKNAVSFDENATLLIVISVFVSIVYAMFVSSLLMLTSILGKTIKESQSYSTPIMMIAAFPGIITAGLGVNELSFHHFAIPILNLFSLLKELIFGVVNIEHIVTMIGSNLLLIIVIFIVSRLLFMKDKWVMN
ncbi:ABC transporter permease [Bacillus salitolerans]|uniref:ABC transporter permease n=1 Tax=Bacillus salitolerans TaxID=1437434 RepID=A0ABW4LUN4_9BACI